MKKVFPGDPEYSWERFYQLPYEYVLRGFEKIKGLRREELHEEELPIALNTAVFANSQRDPKKDRKGFGPMDFAVYKPVEGEGPSSYYSACYLKLIETAEMPPWALFCFKEVASSARGSAGRQYALMSEDAILVGPRKTDEGFTGFLLALESASRETREFRDPDGNVFRLTLPDIPTKVIAREDVTLS